MIPSTFLNSQITMEDASGLDEISLDALSEGFQGFEPAYRARAISIFNRHISQLRQIAQTHGVLQPLNRVLNSQLNEAIRVTSKFATVLSDLTSSFYFNR